MSETKYIFVTGGVVSSIGKGTSAASLGMLLKSRGYRVVLQKFDPYINVDPGTMNPYQHGEVFVTEDGAETDLDLGHYERFLDENLGRVSYVTNIEAAGELKTKPTQHSAQRLREIGISPDVLICRADRPISDDIRKKIALFADTELDSVIAAEDAPNLYAIPLNLHEEGLDDLVLDKLGLSAPHADLGEWRNLVCRMLEANRTVRVAIIGKYMKLQDAYLSVVEALAHAGGAHGLRVELDWVDSEQLVDRASTEERLSGVDGVLVLPGFGHRGAEGKIDAARYARESGTPYLGLCLGMQIEVIEFARNAAGLEMANSTEFEQDTPHPVIDLMPDQVGVDMGGTMRLGHWPCQIVPGTLAEEVYGSGLVGERHRHRYEVNNAYRDALADAGMVFSGTSPDGRLVEIAEIADHPFYIGSQFHPEFKSRPLRPHPLFFGFVGACKDKLEEPIENTVAVPEERAGR